MHVHAHGLRCDKPPVVALHGGPSMTHLSLKPLVLLADEGHPVILYDQVGCGVNPSPNPDPALDPDPNPPTPDPNPNPDPALDPDPSSNPQPLAGGLWPEQPRRRRAPSRGHVCH
jgi:pimeloyl-ACP methyl ester carboxylesterase